MKAKLFTIGALAKQAGVTVETIRFYQSRSLLPQPPKPSGGYRHYDDSFVHRIQFIKHGQSLGFSLTEIEELLSLEDGQQCYEAQQIALKKLAVIRERITNLRRMEKALAELVCHCADNPGSVACPIIASLQKELKVSDSWIGQ